MSWWGKLIGGAFGYLLGGPLGALLGAALGHSFDKGLGNIAIGRGAWDEPDVERIQAAFFTATFSVMGHIAKADGRVSEHEIELARAVMAHMQLDEQQRRAAINLFNEGKRDDFPLDEALQQFRRECHRRSTLLQMFLEIQLQAAYADGDLHEAERRILLRICDALGVSRHQFAQLEAMFRAARHFAGGGTGYREVPRREPSRDQLQEAYAVLGVSASASDDEVKRAYKRLMNQHHPDKLVAKGLPEEMVRLATEKSQEIRAAYDLVRQQRGDR